jgi:hypothetical protein
MKKLYQKPKELILCIFDEQKFKKENLHYPYAGWENSMLKYFPNTFRTVKGYLATSRFLRTSCCIHSNESSFYANLYKF